MKRLVIILGIVTINIFCSITSTYAMTLLENCPTVVIKAEKQYTREEVLQAVYEQTEMWKQSGQQTPVNNTVKVDNKVNGTSFNWSILNNKVVK